MTAKKTDPTPLNRRDFIWMGATSLAGLFGGGSLAWGRQRDKAARLAQDEVTILTNMLTGSGIDLAETDNALTAAQQLIADLTAELAQARSEASSYLSQLEASQLEAATLSTELAELRRQLGESEEQNGLLSGLIELYNALEDEGIDTIIEVGLASLMGTWSSINIIRPLLHNGLTFVNTVIDAFEQRLTTLRDNLLRVLPLTDDTTTQVTAIENTAKEVVKNNRTTLEPVIEFITYVLDNLPFGIGQQVSQTMNLIGDLLSAIPNTLSQLTRLVLTPFSEHLEQTDKGWQQTVVVPVRDRVLGPTATLLDTLTDADAALNDDLATPAQDALNRRGALRDKIARYKQEHDLT